MDNGGQPVVKYLCKYFVVGVKHSKRPVVSNLTCVTLLVEELDYALCGGGG